MFDSQYPRVQPQTHHRLDGERIQRRFVFDSPRRCRAHRSFEESAAEYVIVPACQQRQQQQA
eukprot:8899483-Lingulodinium_polyedra.AAC.1